MTLTTYPLDNYDYVADDAALFHCTRTTGIYAGDDFTFSVTGADNILTMGPGLAWMRLNRFKGVVAALKEEVQVDLGLPDTTRPRIDRVILCYDANKNTTQVAVKRGAAASNPLPPDRSTTEALFEIHLLEVLREPGAVSVSAANVTDLRLDESCCGLMADSVTSVDTNAINAQAKALIQSLREEIAAVKGSTAFLMKSGDTMTGPLKVVDPVDKRDATPKTYVDTLGLVTATHAKTGTAHALTAPAGCGNLKFTAVAPFEDGDTITLNGVAVVPKTQDGEDLTGGAWAAGAVVMCLVSPDGGTLFFRGGGGNGKSEIIVTAPAGSTVTASCGLITKTAAEKNGVWTFRGCGVGAWIITAAKSGFESVSETVKIAESGQLIRYYIELAYWEATISVAYAVGAVCTCSNGGTVLTAPDTSGSHTFAVHHAGDWVLKIEADGKKNTTTIHVTDEIEYSAFLYFILEIYNAGDQCTEVTGGWKGVSSWDIFSFGETSMSITAGGADGTLYTNNKMDLSGFKTLSVECIISKMHYFTVGVSADNATENAEGKIAGTEFSSVASRYEVDISAVESGYPFMFSNETNVKITKVILEG